MAVYGVEYPASYDFLHAIDGVNDAAAFIQSLAESCPQTKMVLGGYSRVPPSWTSSPQRAGRSLDSQVRCRKPSLTIAAVAVFGNPSNRIGDPVTALSPLYGSKAIDLCNGADPVCSTGDDIPGQSLYVEAGMTTQAA